MNSYIVSKECAKSLLHKNFSRLELGMLI
jgi:hypothetical protein